MAGTLSSRRGIGKGGRAAAGFFPLRRFAEAPVWQPWIDALAWVAAAFGFDGQLPGSSRAVEHDAGHGDVSDTNPESRRIDTRGAGQTAAPSSTRSRSKRRRRSGGTPTAERPSSPRPPPVAPAPPSRGAAHPARAPPRRGSCLARAPPPAESRRRSPPRAGPDS